MDVGWMDEKMEEGKEKEEEEAEKETTTGLNEAGERKEPRCEAEQTHRNGVAVKLPPPALDVIRIRPRQSRFRPDFPFPLSQGQEFVSNHLDSDTRSLQYVFTELQC